MPPTSTSNPGHATIPIPIEEEIEEPSCTYTLCGRAKVGLIDGMLTVCQIYSATSALSFGISGNYSSCAVFAGATLACSISHGLYRRLGNISAIIDRFNQAQKAFQTNINTLQTQEIQLQNALSESSQLSTDLQAATSALQNNCQKLKEELIQIKNELQLFRQSNEELNSLNKKLETQVKELTKTNLSIKDRIHEFSLQNKTFKKELVKIENILPRLNAADKTLDQSIDRLDREFDQDLDELQHEITTTQAFIEKIISAFQEENEDLQKKLTYLEQSAELLQSNVQTITQNQLQYKHLIAEYKKVTEELQQIKSQMDPSITAFDYNIHRLGAVLNQIQKARESLDQTLDEKQTTSSPYNPK